MPYRLTALLLASSLAFAAAPPRAIDSFRVTALLTALDDDSFDTRQAADAELRRMGPAVVAYLRDEQLRTASLEVKDRLNRMVRDLTVGERVPELAKMLDHADARHRAHAEETLRKAAADILPALEAQLSKHNGQTRRKLERFISEASGR